MKNNIIRLMKKQWLAIWIIVASLALFTLVVYAESSFTLSPMKRVLVTKDGHGVMFSSNILDEVKDEDDISYYPAYKTGSGPYTIDLLLWNYDAKDELSRYPDNINYRIEAVLTNSLGVPLDAADVGTHSVTITPVSPSGNALTLNSATRSGKLNSQTLIHSNSGSSENSYSISFTSSSGWNLDTDTEICIQIKAIPTNKDTGEEYADLVTLGKIVGLRRARVTGSNGWKAEISEKTDTKIPTAFDAYNLVLSGSGSATITISWDTTKINVNEYFYNSEKCVYGFDFAEDDADESYEIKDNGKDGDWQTITIKADTGKASQNNRNRYTLQLYKLGNLSDTSNPADWSFYAYNQTVANPQNAWIRVNIT